MEIMAKLTNHAQKLFDDSGRIGRKYTNRSRDVKTLNQLIDDGRIKVELSPNGKVWTDVEGSKKKYNCIIRGEGYMMKKYIGKNFGVRSVLTAVGKFLQTDKVREKIMSNVVIPDGKCQKCNGQGRIEQFKHYCSGICFDCYGTGLPKKVQEMIVEVKPKQS